MVNIKITLIKVFIFSICVNVFSQSLQDSTLTKSDNTIIKLEGPILSVSSPYNLSDSDRVGFGTLTWKGEDDETQEWNTIQEVLLQAPSVHLNDPTTNPFARDVQIRGFQSSSVLGTPIGVSVYSDGVKRNDLFGNVVYWDMIPTYSMKSIQLYSGSQPLFGLNALGGTVSYETKSGFDTQKLSIQASGGQYGRLNGIIEYGSVFKNNWALYIGGSYFSEQGWRDYSPSEQYTGIAKLSKKTEQGLIDFSLQYGHADFNGNGPIPLEFINKDPSKYRHQVFTHPDNNKNKNIQLTFRWKHQVSKKIKGLLTTYTSIYNNQTKNGDERPEEEEEEEDDDDEEEEELAVFNLGDVQQSIYGGSYVLSTHIEHQKSAIDIQGGVGFNGGNVEYHSKIQEAKFDDTRKAVAISPTKYIEEGEISGAGPVGLKINAYEVGPFMGAAFNTDSYGFAASLRYDYNSIVLEDQLGTALNGDHDFDSWGGAIKGYVSLSDALSINASLTSAQRNPSPVELGCADEDAPCRLPNGFLADPPLDPVRSVSIETGLRWDTPNVKLTSTLYNTLLQNDIYFIAGNVRGQGYFDNVGNSKRFGVENTLSLNVMNDNLRLILSYTYQQPTFESDFKVSSPSHPKADNNGEIQVSKGNIIPLIPQNIFKYSLEYDGIKNLRMEFEQVYNSSQYLRGDEANLTTTINGYWVSYFNADYTVNNFLTLNFKIANMFDADYETFGLLGEVDEAGELLLNDKNALQNPAFVSPAYPFNLQVRLVFTIDHKK